MVQNDGLYQSSFLNNGEIGQFTFHQIKFTVEKMLKTKSVVVTMRKFQKIYSYKSTRKKIENTNKRWVNKATFPDLNEGKCSRIPTNFTASRLFNASERSSMKITLPAKRNCEGLSPGTNSFIQLYLNRHLLNSYWLYT